MKPTLGTVDGRPLAIDVARLLETRALLTASSGWGKSWALRRLIEQTHGQGAMQLVIDPEGEFASLRERFDFVIAGKGGDCPAEPRSAELLARRLLELGTSAVLDLYELPSHDRVRFVHRFLEALVDAPKSLWRPALVVIDEAHMFAPEGSQSESRDAVRGLMTRGRKRGYAGILATQRLAKLDKDASDAGTVLVGRYTLDVDLKRAAAALGMGTTGHAEIRRLGRGEFFGYGPAISEDVVRVQVGDVQTTHPKSGQRAAAAPAARGTVLKVLEQLRDLPAEAEAEARTADELRAKLHQVERELRAAKSTSPAPSAEQLEAAWVEGTQAARAELAGELEQRDREISKAIEAAEGLLQAAAKEAFQRILEAVGEPMAEAARRIAPRPPAVRAIAPRAPLPSRAAAAPITASAAPARQAPRSSAGAGGLEQRILDALAWLEDAGIDQPDKIQVGFLSDATLTGGYGGNTIGRLRTDGLVAYPSPGKVCLTGAGRGRARSPERTLTPEDIQRAVCEKVGGLGADLLRALIEIYPADLSKVELGERCGVTLTGGYGGNTIGRLHNTVQAVTYPAPGRVRAAAWLFLERA